jgi:hypothetical protein
MHLNSLAGLEVLEPPTTWFEDSRSHWSFN